MPRSFDGHVDSDTHEDLLAIGSPTNVDDGDVSNVAVGAASPIYESQSPVDVSVHLSQNDNADTDAAARFTAIFPPVSEDGVAGTRAMLPGVVRISSPLGAGSSTATGAAAGPETAGSNVAIASSAYAATERMTPTIEGEAPATHRLVLNKHNLATFEDSVQRGAVPLRTDVIDDRNFVGFARTAAAAAVDADAKRHGDMDASVSIMTNYPSRSQREASILTQAENEHLFSSSTPLSLPGNGMPGANREVPATGLAHRDSSSHLTAAERFSAVSVASTMGSPLRHSADPLSQENLQLHIKELTSGAPVPLTSENIGSALPIHTLQRTTRAPVTNGSGDDGAGESSNAHNSNNDAGAAGGAGGTVGGGPAARRDMSLVVEASEAAGSEVASTVGTSVLRTTLRNAPHSDAAMEELWSTTSTHDADGKSQASWAPSTDALQSLSKKSLRQLRRQLESGETPLRPEILDGLSNVAKAMNMRSEPSPSMIVEVPRDETGRTAPTSDRAAESRRGTASGGGGGGSHHRMNPTDDDDLDDADVDDNEGGVEEEEEDDAGSGSRLTIKSPVNGAADNAASDAGAMSFHSTYVEAPNRSHGQRDGTACENDAGASRSNSGTANPGNRTGNVMGPVDSVSSNGTSTRASPAAVSREPPRALVGPEREGRVASGAPGDMGSVGQLLDVSADLSANNGDLFGDVDDDVDDVDDDERNMNDDKSTTALSHDDVDDEGHNDESAFMTEDGTERHDDIAYLKRCLAEVMRTLKDSQKDQVKLSQQIQHIKDELNPNRASNRGADFSGRHSERPYSDSSPLPTTATTGSPAAADAVGKHITSLRADMDEMRLYMREMQRSQIALINKIERLQERSTASSGYGAQDGSQASSGFAPKPAGIPHRIRVVVECATSLFHSGTEALAVNSDQVTRFLMPMSANATIGQCKEEFLRRLAGQNPTLAADLTTENTHIEMNGHRLFDSLVIGTDLQLDEDSKGECSLILKKS